MTRLPVNSSLTLGQCVVLKDELAHYVKNVLRLRQGAEFIIFNGDGYDYQVILEELDKKNITLTVLTRLENTCESPLKITLFQGISKGDRMDTVMQKATELGVTQVFPVITSHCSVKQSTHYGEKKTRHWQHVANFASAQSGRAIMPEIHPPIALEQVLSEFNIDGIKWVMSPQGLPASALQEFSKKKGEATNVSVLIGPEGGLSESDLSLATKSGFTPVKLGNRILRTETAAIVALATLQTYLGDF